MEHNDDLVKLAGVVEDLLANFNKLKQEKSDLVNSLQEKENYIQELEAKISGLKDEKTDVCQRVSGILDSIEEWERNQNTEKNVAPAEKSTEPVADTSSQLFSMDS